MSTEKSVVAIYRQHSDADLAIQELQARRSRHAQIVDRGKGLSHDEQVVGLLQYRRPHEVLGKVGAFWGRFLGASIRICFLHDSRPRPTWLRTGSCVDRAGLEARWK